MIRLFCVAASALLAGCSYNVATDVSPAYEVYASYDDKLPGRFAVYVDSEEMKEEVKVSGFACSAHDFPVDAREAFRISAIKTVENLVGNAELVDQPLDRTQLVRGNYAGLIRIEAEDMDVDLVVIPGFWTSELEADAEIAASVAVDGPQGRMLGTTVEGDDDHKADAGMGCEGGADAVGRAIEKAMKETFERLGERVANSPRLRAAPQVAAYR